MRAQVLLIFFLQFFQQIYCSDQAPDPEIPKTSDARQEKDGSSSETSSSKPQTVVSLYPHKAGIKNPRFNCYMNAIFSCLYSIPFFQNSVYESISDLPSELPVASKSVLLSLADMFTKMRTNSGPISIMETMIPASRAAFNWRVGQFQCVLEYWDKFVEHMPASFKTVFTAKLNTNFFQKSDGMLIKSKSEDYFHISVTAPIEPTNLSDIIDGNFIDNEAEEYIIEPKYQDEYRHILGDQVIEEKVRIPVFNTQTFENTPNVLIFGIKRLLWNREIQRNELNEVPMTFDAITVKGEVYKSCAWVVFVENGPHYYSLISDFIPSKKLFIHNDSNVTYIDLAGDQDIVAEKMELIKKSSTMVFYVKVSAVGELVRNGTFEKILKSEDITPIVLNKLLKTSKKPAQHSSNGIKMKKTSTSNKDDKSCRNNKRTNLASGPETEVADHEGTVPVNDHGPDSDLEFDLFSDEIGIEPEAEKECEDDEDSIVSISSEAVIKDYPSNQSNANGATRVEETDSENEEYFDILYDKFGVDCLLSHEAGPLVQTSSDAVPSAVPSIVDQTTSSDHGNLFDQAPLIASYQTNPFEQALSSDPAPGFGLETRSSVQAAPTTPITAYQITPSNQAPQSEQAASYQAPPIAFYQVPQLSSPLPTWLYANAQSIRSSPNTYPGAFEKLNGIELSRFEAKIATNYQLGVDGFSFSSDSVALELVFTALASNTSSLLALLNFIDKRPLSCQIEEMLAVILLQMLFGCQNISLTHFENFVFKRTKVSILNKSKGSTLARKIEACLTLFNMAFPSILRAPFVKEITYDGLDTDEPTSIVKARTITAAVNPNTSIPARIGYFSGILFDSKVGENRFRQVVQASSSSLFTVTTIRPKFEMMKSISFRLNPYSMDYSFIGAIKYADDGESFTADFVSNFVQKTIVSYNTTNGPSVTVHDDNGVFFQKNNDLFNEIMSRSFLIFCAKTESTSIHPVGVHNIPKKLIDLVREKIIQDSLTPSPLPPLTETINAKRPNPYLENESRQGATGKGKVNRQNPSTVVHQPKKSKKSNAPYGSS